MNRSKQLRRKARIWQVVGIATFVIGAVLVWERVSYNMHDFYAENYDVTSVSELDDLEFSAEQKLLLQSAHEKMDSAGYWEAISDLQTIKEVGGASRQVAEWYKVLCLIGLEEKEEALKLLTYYVEQPDFTFKKAEAQRLLEMY